MAKQKLQLHYDPERFEKNPQNTLLFKLLNATESTTDSVSIKVGNILRTLVNYNDGEQLINPAIEAIIRKILEGDYTVREMDPNIFYLMKHYAEGLVRAEITVDLTEDGQFKMISSINAGKDGQYFSTLSVKGNDVEYEYEFINK